jgi:hypothetical protein
MELNAMNPQIGTKFTPKQMKAAKSFFKLMDDTLRMHMMVTLCANPDTRKKWDTKFAKRHHFKLEELPEEAQEYWRTHLFISKQYEVWLKLVSDNYSTSKPKQAKQNEFPKSDQEALQEEGRPGSRS